MPGRGLLLVLLCLATPSLGEGDDAAAAAAWLRDAVQAAHEGKPRAELLEEWRRCAKALPGNEYARAMADLYAGLVEDDAKFKRLEAEEEKALPAAGAADYWIHELRDVAVLEYEGRYQPRTFLGWPEGNAVDKLVDLGWDAIPALIEHLDDPRPTRSARAYESSMFQFTYASLFSHGDLARLALRAITGRSFTTTRSGRLWWSGVREQGPVAFFTGILRTPTASRKGYAARQLVERDRDANLPVVLDALSGASSEDLRYVLAEIEGAFDASHRPVLEKYLKSDDLLLVALAARLLWTRCDSDEGAGPLIALLRKTAASDGEGFFFHGEEAIRALLAIDVDKARVLFASLLSDESPVVRRAALQCAANVRYPEVLDALLEQMLDETATGFTTDLSNPIRFRDLAAEAAARMLRYEKEFPRDEPPEQRDAYIVELRLWIAKQREIDWSKLRTAEGD